jgi:hypothetical protein
MAAIAAAALLLPVSAAQAWGPEAHSAIGAVAFKNLRLAAQSDVDWIVKTGIPALNAETKSCRINPKELFRTVNPANRSETDLANWADCYAQTHPDAQAWHYAPVPLGRESETIAADRSWCPTSGCIATAIAANLEKLSQPNLPPAEAAKALALVIHLVGDLHQPLRVATNNDRNGLGVTVHAHRAWLRGSRLSATNFLELWDSPLAALALGPDLESAEAKLEENVAVIPPSVADDASSVAGAIDAADQWIADSHQLARDAYGALVPSPAGGAGKFEVVLDPGYVKLQSVVAERQLTLAAVRLIAVLNAALQWAPPDQ